VAGSSIRRDGGQPPRLCDRAWAICAYTSFA
jgi:hypothetical protein